MQAYVTIGGSKTQSHVSTGTTTTQVGISMTSQRISLLVPFPVFSGNAGVLLGFMVSATAHPSMMRKGAVSVSMVVAASAQVHRLKTAAANASISLATDANPYQAGEQTAAGLATISLDAAVMASRLRTTNVSVSLELNASTTSLRSRTVSVSGSMALNTAGAAVRKRSAASLNTVSLNTAGTATKTSSGSSIDSDAQTYFNALSISSNLTLTDSSTLTPTQVLAAIDTHVKALKAAGVWTKLAVIKPYIGGTSAQHAVNAKSPGTYNSAFTGSPTHNAYGVVLNGTTNYDNSGYAINSVAANNNFSIGAYNNTNVAGNGGVLFGASTSAVYTDLFPRYTDGVTYADGAANAATYTEVKTTGVTNTSGLWILTSYNSSGDKTRASRNGSTLASGSQPKTTLPALNVFFGAQNGNGSSDSYYPARLAYSFIASSALTTTEETDLYNAILTLQTTLKRN